MVGASQLLTGVGTLLAGLAAIVAIILSNLGGSTGESSVPSIPIVTASEPSASSVASPSITPASESPGFSSGTILFRDSLHGLVPGMFEGVYGGCTHRFDEGYHIGVVAREDQGIVCADGLEDVAPALVTTTSVRVAVTVRFLESESSTSTIYGPGDAGIQCRLRGLVNTGDYYIGSLSPTGYWEIDRFDAGQQKLLSAGVAADFTTESGTPRFIAFECLGDPGARTVLRFSVDGRIIGSVVDEVGLAAGSVGLGATGYPGASLEVAFEDLEVAARQ
ncbi:MAG: hypothetical protein ABIZ52_05525 [Candidatus Limnocylindrales bacterium]